MSPSPLSRAGTVRPVLALALALLLLAAVLSAATLTAAQRASGAASRAARLHQQLVDVAINQCKRVNVLRAEVNRDSAIAFAAETLTAQVLAERSLLASLSPADRRERIADSRRLLVNVARRRYRPQTDCAAALAHPGAYRPPAALAFGVTDGQIAHPLRPPASSGRPAPVCSALHPHC